MLRLIILILILSPIVGQGQITSSLVTSPFSFLNYYYFIPGQIHVIKYKVNLVNDGSSDAVLENWNMNIKSEKSFFEKKYSSKRRNYFKLLPSGHAVNIGEFYNDKNSIDTTKIKFDDKQQLTQFEDTYFQYDNLGRVITVKTPLFFRATSWKLTEFQYDDKNRVVKRLYKTLKNDTVSFEFYEDIVYLDNGTIKVQLKSSKDGRSMSGNQKYLISRNGRRVRIYTYNYDLLVTEEKYFLK